MENKKAVMAYSIFKDENGFWRHTFGIKGGTMSISGPIPNEELAKRAVTNQFEQAKEQYGSDREVELEEINL